MRTGITTTVVLAFLITALLSPLTSTAGEKMKVVYHVSELEKVPFALNNMRNHIKGVGAEKLDMILVAHGPSVKAFHNEGASEKVQSMVDELQLEGVAFNACGNTMNVLGYELADLLPDFIRRDEGGVVRIAELQSKGYIYIRP